MSSDSEKFSYKKALDEIEEIIEFLESDNPDVDELSEMVNKAAELIKLCKAKLKNTEEDLDKIFKDED